MTMTISMLSDLLSCFTAHLFVCYRASAIIFSYQLSIAGSLWNLFRGMYTFSKRRSLIAEPCPSFTGKRNNILRNRKDAWDYDVDQLLLGTMLFTLVAFLSPTTFTYYAFFATVCSIVLCRSFYTDVTCSQGSSRSSGHTCGTGYDSSAHESFPVVRSVVAYEESFAHAR